MRNALQIYKKNLAHLSSKNIFKQHFDHFGSGSPRRPPGTLQFGDVDESLVDNVSHDSELSYNLKGSQRIIHKKQPLQGDVPLRMTLAITNKMLFGPLLETSQEKKRRLKREARGIDETEHMKKHKKKQKKTKPFIQPLILKPENSHYLITDDEKDLHTTSSKENFSHEEGKIGEGLAYNKKKLILNSDSNIVNNYQERIAMHSSVNRKKIVIFPHKKASEESVHLCNDEYHENDEIFFRDLVRNIEKHPQLTKELSSKHNEQEIRAPSQDINNYQYIASANDKSEEVASFLSVDNSKFSAVPQSLDITEMENFPLFSDIVPANSFGHKDRVQGSSDIISIGLFDGGYQKLPSVRKILEETMPLPNKIALEKWKAKMIKELGEEGFKQYRQGLLDRGKLLHGCVQSKFSGATLEDDHTLSIKELWRSITPVLPSVSNVQVLESRLIHPYLYYQGAVDCIASYRGIPILIEWKTSSKPKLSVKSMFDDPLQVVAYLGALNFDGNYKLPQPIDSAMLVVAYESGLPAHVHILKRDDCQHYWRIWCSRICQFWKLQKPETAQVD